MLYESKQEGVLGHRSQREAQLVSGALGQGSQLRTRHQHGTGAESLLVAADPMRSHAKVPTKGKQTRATESSLPAKAASTRESTSDG